ncbi:GTP-binding nuclear protein Ran-like [Drosophila gunungcola]|uniref:Uncharacterized protein n=1 Tax=Drosophila gunungcola TaxID=103775 RepID=A0A9P9Z0T6_9MUSC|nr:GTP-binding nuclear protein Ran-like [Drosophila gunungcola]KAI8046423.1 hypothetical protein M5D96_002627 [Drosophila gunungcola]
MELSPSRPRNQTYKCLLLGDSGVGKSTFLRRHATGKFTEQHVPTRGLLVHTVLLQADYQAVALELWDVAGDARHGGLQNGYYFHAKCAIVMFDLSAESSAASVVQWLREVDDICDLQISVVICGNKADLKPMPQKLLYRRHRSIDYCEISARAAWNLDEPLKFLCRRLLNKSNLVLISQPIVKAMPGCLLDEQKIRRRVVDIRKRALPEQNDEMETSTATKSHVIVLN